MNNKDPIILAEALRGVLDEIESIPGLDQNYPGLLRLKHTIAEQIANLELNISSCLGSDDNPT